MDATRLAGFGLFSMSGELLLFAKSLNQRPEIIRTLHVTKILCDAVALRVATREEVFEAAYSDRAGRKYWEAYLAQPCGLYAFATALSANLFETAEDLERLRALIIFAVQDAARVSEPWLFGDLEPLLALNDRTTGFAHLSDMKVDPRRAAEWLLSKPMLRHLVPLSLCDFLQSCGRPDLQRVSREASKKAATDFARKYVSEMQETGGTPTIGGLEHAAKTACIPARRDDLRAALHKITNVRRGRPCKRAER